MILQELQNISLTNIFYFESYAYRNFNGNNIKSLPHTSDLQTKAFQGHYLKHVILQELITKHFSYKYFLFRVFASYAYRNFNRNNIKVTSSYCWPPNQDFLRSLPQTRGTTRITEHFSYNRMPIGTSLYSKFISIYKNYRTFLLQIFFISRRMPIGTSIGTISSHFLILLTSKPRLFKGTTSNTWHYKNYRTFLLQIFFISNRMPIGTSIRTISSHSLILFTSKPRFFKVTTSNTWYYKNYRTFLLQILLIWRHNYFSMGVFVFVLHL